jgi:hypothetical protein
VTIQEVEAHVEGKRIIRHRTQVFFTTYDPEEAMRFKELGASVMPYEIRGVTYWEVFLASMLDPMPEENDDGEIVDMRGRFILNHFRERDGFDIPRLSFGDPDA